jgi:SH3-like domain-containing protein
LQGLYYIAQFFAYPPGGAAPARISRRLWVIRIAAFLFLAPLFAGCGALLWAQAPAHAQTSVPLQQEQEVQQEHGQATQPHLGPSGRPLPRFASLRAREINMRSGPGSNYPILWVYRLPGLPVEIIDEFETWRRVRDWQGSTGWIHQNLLSGRRGALITGGLRKLRRKPDEAAAGVALLDQGVLAKLEGCEGPWCRITVETHEGWLKRDEFFGIYPDEKIP